MFARINKATKAIIAVIAVSTLVVACGGGSAAEGLGVDRKIVSEAPEHKPTYNAGDHPEERTMESVAIKTDECPSVEEVRSFVERHKNDVEYNMLFPFAYWQLDTASIESEGHTVWYEIDHRTFETIIGTMNPKCLPSLDGNVDYRPGRGNEKLREQWYNFQNVYTHALELHEAHGSSYAKEPSYGDSVEVYMDPDSYEFTPQAKTLATYAVSLQLLGVISALSGGPYFATYGNNIPHLTNPETFGRDYDRAWSTALPAIGNPLAFYILDGEKVTEEHYQQFLRDYEAEHGHSFEDGMKQLEDEMEQHRKDMEAEYGTSN